MKEMEIFSFFRMLLVSVMISLLQKELDTFKDKFGTLTGFENKKKQSCPMVFLNTFTIFHPNMARKKVVGFQVLVSCSSALLGGIQGEIAGST